MNEDKLYPVDYSVFVMSRQEKNKFIIIAAAALFLTGYIFFQSLIISGIFSMGSFLYPAYKGRELIEKRKRALLVQFKDALYSLSSSLGVGKSLESSFKYALNDLRVLYPDEDTYILKEFELICRKIEMNVPVEKALEDLSKRSGLEDINSFTEVIAICKRTGGNLVEVVKSTSKVISGKIEIEQEINILLSSKKYEQKILNIMPILFIGLINFGGSGYTDALYTSFTGYLIMGLALALLALSYLVSHKIMDIKV